MGRNVLGWNLPGGQGPFLRELSALVSCLREFSMARVRTRAIVNMSRLSPKRDGRLISCLPRMLDFEPRSITLALLQRPVLESKSKKKKKK